MTPARPHELEHASGFGVAPSSPGSRGAAQIPPVDPFDRIVGQRRAVPFLREIRDGICLGAHPHPLLFLGRSGHGKTSLSKAFAESLGAEFIRIDCGPELRSEHLVEKLLEIKGLAVVFCDEFQAMRKRVQEILYGAIDACVVPKLDGRRIDRCAPSVTIAPFILIGATNEPGRLLPAMRARMVNVVMEEYSEPDLRSIVAQKAERFLITLSDRSTDLVVRASGGSPRAIVQILQSIECTSASWRFGYEIGEGLGGGPGSVSPLGDEYGTEACGGPDGGDDFAGIGASGGSLAGNPLGAGLQRTGVPGGDSDSQPRRPARRLEEVVGGTAGEDAARFRPCVPDELVERALTWMGLDRAGLDATGRTILGTISQHGRATAELIATVLGLDIAYARERLAELRARRLTHAAPGRGWVLTEEGVQLVAELDRQA